MQKKKQLTFYIIPFLIPLSSIINRNTILAIVINLPQGLLPLLHHYVYP